MQAAELTVLIRDSNYSCSIKIAVCVFNDHEAFVF